MSSITGEKLEEPKSDGVSFTTDFENMKQVKEIIDQKNRRLQRSGSTARFTFSVTDPYWCLPENADHHVRLVDVTFNRPVVKVGDWTFVGCIDREDGGLVYHCFADGLEDYQKTKSLVCDHCGTNRDRTRTYIIKNDAGEFMQVGKVCVQPFLGLRIPEIWALHDTFKENIEELNSHDPMPHYDVKAALELAIEVSDRGRKFVKKADGTTFHPSTVMEVEELLQANVEVENTDEADRLVTVVNAQTGRNEYVTNLQTVVAGQYVSARNLALLCSAVRMLLRSDKITTTIWADAHAGQEGDKLSTQQVRVVSHLMKDAKNYSTGGPETHSILTLRDAEGRMLTYFAHRIIRVQEQTDVTLKRATIKKCGEYQGAKQTVLARAVFEEVPATEYYG